MKRSANLAKRTFAVILLCAWAAAGSRAQTLTTLISFDGTNGAIPYDGLVQAINGELYGSTFGGGANGGGTVFRITPSGALTTLYNFCLLPNSGDGSAPVAGLVQATNGDLYGTTIYGGTNGTSSSGGTVFQITPSGTLTTLYSFCSQANCGDGEYPAGLIQAADGALYGTTTEGGVGAYCFFGGCGTVFKVTPSGTLTTLYSFCPQANCADGQYPNTGLVQAANGALYGTTNSGGAHSEGTVFKITPSGTLTTLYSFCSLLGCADGSSPERGLVQAANGDLYGTTEGGAHAEGTVFKITPSGTLTTLYNFCSLANCADGALPFAGLIQATNGDIYGTTYGGGAGGCGTVFQITPGGALTTVYSFCAQGTYPNCPDGQGPEAPLVQATNGDFYGTTSGGGTNGDGTVLSLSLGLGPFIESLPTAGKVGSVVEILGANLIGASGVTFHGTAAVFKVVAASLITTSLPTGATTGRIQVVTPSGTLTSNVPFRVLP